MNDRIKISGSARKFDQTELEQRQEGYRNAYLKTDQCTTVVHGDIAFGFLTRVIEMTGRGYTLSSKYPIGCAPQSYYCSMTKPESEQAADLEVINQRVKDEYVAELEAELEEYKQLLTAQLLQTRQLAEAKKIADKEAKVLAEIEREVADTFGELIVPE